MGNPEHALEALNRAINEGYAAAKFWQNVGAGIQLLIFGFGALALFFPTFSPTYPPLAFFLAAALAAIKMRTSFWKSHAESVKRGYEFYDGFGGQIPGSLLADLEVFTPEKLSAQVLSDLDSGLKFASATAAGERRAVENLQESAWWSKAGARISRNLLGSLILIVLVVSLVILVAVAVDGTANAPQAKYAAGRIVAASLICIFSLNLLPAVWALHRFATKAHEIDAECDRRLSKAEISPVESMRLMSEYQLSRASAPLIPTFIWRWKRKKLNQAWDRHKAIKE